MGKVRQAKVWPERTAWLALGVLLLAQSVACSAAPAKTPVVEQSENPTDLLRRAVSRMLALESAAFTLEHLRGSTNLLPGLEMYKASGVVEVPDKVRLKVEAESTSPRFFVAIDIVTIDGRAYMTNFLTGQWQSVPPESLPFSFADLGRALGDIIEAVEQAELVGMETINGYNAYRIKGRINSQDLSALVPGAAPDFDVRLELWLDEAEAILHQVLITGKVVSTDVPDAVRLLTLDDIDVPVDITVPD